jgi:hypothetical protein
VPEQKSDKLKPPDPEGEVKVQLSPPVKAQLSSEAECSQYQPEFIVSVPSVI